MPAVPPQRRSSNRTTLESVQDLDPLDRAILTYALQWLPYGDLEDTVVNFGLPPDKYLLRVLDLVDRHRPHLAPSTASRLTSMCARRLRARNFSPGATVSGA